MTEWREQGATPPHRPRRCEPRCSPVPCRGKESLIELLGAWRNRTRWMQASVAVDRSSRCATMHEAKYTLPDG
eukprot:1699279-Prymnesium_polylepis.3